MATPTPSGITAQPWGNGWHVVSWDDVPGADYYENQHQGESHTTRQSEPKTALLAVSGGTQRWTKIRNVVGGEPSGWVTVTLNDQGEIVDIDGDEPPPPPGRAPNPPRNVQITDVTASGSRVHWTAPASGGTPVDHYFVSWSKGNSGTSQQDTTTSLEYLLSGLDSDADYAVGVSSVGSNGAQSRVVIEHFHTEPEDTPPPEKPPAPPSGLRLVQLDHEYASADVAWAAQDDADYWEILLDTVWPRYRKANTSEYTFSDLTEGQEYGWRVRAVRKTASGKLLRSGPVRSEFTFENTPPPPPVPVPTPTGVRTHCITTSTAIVEWERALVDGWEVWIGDRSTAQFTTSTRHTVRGLRPNTSYTVSVIARVGDAESEIATDTFVTLDQNEIEGDLPTPTGLHLETPRPGVLQATWDGEVPPFVLQGRTNEAFYVSCDGLATITQTDRNGHEWTGLGTGEHVVEVYRATGAAVSGIARSAATVKGVHW